MLGITVLMSTLPIRVYRRACTSCPSVFCYKILCLHYSSPSLSVYIVQSEQPFVNLFLLEKFLNIEVEHNFVFERNTIYVVEHKVTRK